MLYHLLACLHLCLKVERRIEGITFDDFRHQCESLKEYKLLEAHFAPTFDPQNLEWTPELYIQLEYAILNSSLRFKTNFVTPAELVYQIACAVAQSNNSAIENGALDNLIQGALFRTYLCLLGK